ncbi:AT-rich interaction domain 6 [Eucyclogobius newberryi]|uniref:AT-rich interaction domain 6 n=1 Tax=Eucyclogobius newberryi TaxID=166745 RepID=UPI003B58D704
MDTQMQTAMAHNDIQEARESRSSEENAEEQFFKDLYLFMKKRDTPIERIPHLGFKQLDLYVMFKTVQEVGGYHQVTAQQLWKQVYNTLGGNPRSTSAATCTRRHYEKLLLPYECHIKGLRLKAVQQPRHYHYVGYRKDEENGPPPAKRRPVLLPLQNPSKDLSKHHSSLFPLSPSSYHKFYYPAYQFPPLPQSLPTPRLPVPPPPPQAYLPSTTPLPSSTECPPLTPNCSEHLKDPLEHLRYLAKQYENSAGFSEPLNLSVKPSSQDITTNPVSSFAPPSSHKNPKFLNKVSPLYTSPNVKSDAAMEDTSFSNNLKQSPSPKSSAVVEQNKKEAIERQPSPEVSFIKELNGENRGRMEIEIPLSVFNNWLQTYGPQPTLHGSRQLLIPERNTTKSTEAERVAADTSFETKQSKLDGEHSRHMPSQRCTNEPYPPSQYHCNNRRPTFDMSRNAVSRDGYLFNDRQLNKPYCIESAPTKGWDLSRSSGPTFPKQVNVTNNPATVPRDLRASKPYVA